MTRSSPRFWAAGFGGLASAVLVCNAWRGSHIPETPQRLETGPAYRASEPRKPVAHTFCGLEPGAQKFWATLSRLWRLAPKIKSYYTPKYPKIKSYHTPKYPKIKSYHTPKYPKIKSYYTSKYPKIKSYHTPRYPAPNCRPGAFQVDILDPRPREPGIFGSPSGD